MNQTTLQTMCKMRFHGMESAFRELSSKNISNDMTVDQAINYLIQSEWEYRENRRIERNIQSAKFRYQATLDNISFTPERNLDKNQILRLSDCSFIDKGENVLITGYTGVGKSYLATAIGYQACLKGKKVYYRNAQKLFAALRVASVDGTYLKELDKIEKQDLLIIDDFGLEILDNKTSLSLLEILEDRTNKRSTIIASQVPYEKWYDVIAESTIADAILDRIITSSHKISLKGDSLRKKR